MSARDVRYQAAVVEQGRLLLLRCVPPGDAGFWVLPGGGREAGESAEACVTREVREEAGVEIAVGPLLYDVPADPPDGTYARWRTYLCRIVRGEPAPGGGEHGAELTAVRWLPLGEPASWEPAIRDDRFLHPQLLRIVTALRAPGRSAWRASAAAHTLVSPAEQGRAADGEPPTTDHLDPA